MILESEHKEVNEKGEVTEIIYLTAYCHLRDSERYFRIDCILELKVLDLF